MCAFGSRVLFSIPITHPHAHISNINSRIGSVNHYDGAQHCLKAACPNMIVHEWPILSGCKSEKAFHSKPTLISTMALMLCAAERVYMSVKDADADMAAMCQALDTDTLSHF